MGFLKILIITITVAIARKLQLSGIRDSLKTNIEVEKGVQVSFEIFGDNIPEKGFYFTTADRCEDFNNTQINDIDNYFIDSVSSYGTHGVFHVHSFRFNASKKIYHLCHPNASVVKEDYLRVTLKGEGDPKEYWSDIIFCVYCILMAAYASGMTIGFMKFSIADLNRMLECAEPVRTRASRILRFRKRSNWLVCTFAMFGTIHSVMFTTKVEKFFEDHPQSYALCIAVPTIFLFLFAEMTPQAFCNSRFGFNLASGLWPVTVVVFVICAPVAWPASRLIDFILERDVREVLTEEEKLRMIKNMAKKTNLKERRILERATVFSSKTVEDIMTPIDKVFLLPSSQRLNKTTILTLVEKGFTRVPIRDDKNRDNIYGVLNVKDLINYSLTNEPTVSRILSLTDKKSVQMKYVVAEMKAQQLLQHMRTGGFHIATVTKYRHNVYKLVGIITIEDILAQIFGEIEDESAKSSKNRGGSYADNMVINWCREAGTNVKYPLSFSQQLLVIQNLLEQCPVLRRLGIEVMQAKQLLSPTRIRNAFKNQKIAFNDSLLIIWEGVIEIKRVGEVIAQEVIIKKMDKNLKKAETNEGVQTFIVGKPILWQVVKALQIQEENLIRNEYIEEITVRSFQCLYFKINVQDIVDVVNETETTIARTDEMQSLSMIVDLEEDAMDDDDDKSSKHCAHNDPILFGLLAKHPISVSRTPSPSPSGSAENARTPDSSSETSNLLKPSDGPSKSDLEKRLGNIKK